MTFYLGSANEKNYDHKGAFKKLGAIDWVQHVKCKPGDILYLYCTRDRKILYKCLIEKTDIPFEKKIHDVEFWKDGNEDKNGTFMRIRPILFVDDSPFNLAYLRTHGIFPPMKQIMIRDSDVLSDLTLYFQSESHDEDYPDSYEMDKYTEGARKTVLVNKYERNPDARKACIEANGCYCHICGMDFSKMYPGIGDGFIHVHHKVPISEIGEEYVLDPVNDLIPLCANCHAMVHKAGCSIDAVKKVINKK